MDPKCYQTLSRDDSSSHVVEYKTTKKVTLRDEDHSSVKRDDVEEASKPRSYANFVISGGSDDSQANVYSEYVEVEKGDIVLNQVHKGLELSTPFKGQLHRTWQNSILVKILGHTIGYNVLITMSKIIWISAQPFGVIDLDKDCPQKRTMWQP